MQLNGVMEHWGNVILAVVTAAATLLGVWLTQRHASELRRHDRKEQRRIEQRVALADALLAGRAAEDVLSKLIDAATRSVSFAAVLHTEGRRRC